MTKPGRRNGRPLEPRGLKRVARTQERARERRGGETATPERAHACGAGHGERAACDRESHGEKREERIDRDSVLHLHERHAPHRSDDDERRQRLHAWVFAIVRSQRRRISAENGPTIRQYRENARRAASSTAAIRVSVREQPTVGMETRDDTDLPRAGARERRDPCAGAPGRSRPAEDDLVLGAGDLTKSQTLE